MGPDDTSLSNSDENFSMGDDAFVVILLDTNAGVETVIGRLSSCGEDAITMGPDDTSLSNSDENLCTGAEAGADAKAEAGAETGAETGAEARGAVSRRSCS